MLIYFQYLIILFLINIRYIKNTFTIDFSFLLPDSNNESIISNNIIDNSVNASFYRNISYYFKIKPMIKLYIGNPLQSFFIELSSQNHETILNNNTIKYNYFKSSSFKLLSNINTSFGASESIRLGTQNKPLINDFNFIITNDSNIKSQIGFGKSMLYYNKIYQEKEREKYSLLNQLNSKKFIDTTELTIKYKDDFSGELILGTNYTGMKIDESQYLEFPYSQNSSNRYLQSIYIEDSTISSTKRQQKDLLANEKRKRIKIDFNSNFITISDDVFEKIKLISFMSYINAGICEVKKNEDLKTQYLICNDDILNSNLDRLLFIINWKKNITISLNDLFLPYTSVNEKKKNIFGIISSENNETINIGTILLKKYMICLNRERSFIRLYLKNIQAYEAPTDIFGIVGIITLTVIIFMLMIYMVSTICGKDKYEPNYKPRIQKFLLKKGLNTSMQSNESF